MICPRFVRRTDCCWTAGNDPGLVRVMIAEASTAPIGLYEASAAISPIVNIVSPAPPGQYCSAILLIPVIEYEEGTVKLIACPLVIGLWQQPTIPVNHGGGNVAVGEGLVVEDGGVDGLTDVLTDADKLDDVLCDTDTLADNN